MELEYGEVHYMEMNFVNYISLGFFCEVAQDLEKMGLRNQSSPFDWGISRFPGVIEAMDNGFEGFMDYDNLSQVESARNHYHDDKYDFFFFHDFNQYDTLEEQYPLAKEKYDRRIKRFLESIKEPTLFVKYISSEKKDSDGKSLELAWIEENLEYIMSVFRRYNPANDIVFIGDETLQSSIIKVYNVKKDEGDKVSRSPIINNSELYMLMKDIIFPGKEQNALRYLRKAKKKKNIWNRVQKKVKKEFMRMTRKPYIHSKIYSYQ